MTVEKFFEKQSAAKIASDRAYAMRDQIAREHGINLGDAQKHPDYKTLETEAHALYWEADALTPHVIRANLERLNLEDIEVTGVLVGNDRKTRLGQEQMLLTDLCGLRYRGLAKRLGVAMTDMALMVIVEKDGASIGVIDCDGDFDYESAPDLRTALGWKIATDGGRTSLIEFFDLNKAASSIIDTVNNDGVSEKAFFGAYFQTLKRAFVYGRTSRFSDGYCGAATTLWRVATRVLGNEHPGYDFAY